MTHVWVPRASRVVMAMTAAFLALACSSSSDSRSFPTKPDTAVGDPGAPGTPDTPPAVATVVVALDSSTLAIGHNSTVVAVVKDSGGAAIAGRTVVWSSSNSDVARVADGIVTGVAAGTARIAATVGGVSSQATITIVAVAAPPASGSLANECASAGSGWIFCDDFDTDRLAKYFEYDNSGGKFVRVASSGVSGSTGMRATYTKGQAPAGSLKLAFGRTPSSYFKAADAGTANYREIYWRFYLRLEPGWAGDGAMKLTRITSLAKADWSQAMIAHGWSGSDTRYLILDPASGTDESGNLLTAGYNDFAHLRWLGATQTNVKVEDQSNVGKWMCLEFHVKLNDAGQSNGVFDLKINGSTAASKAGINFVGSYATYGLNAIMLEQFVNDGAPAANVRTLDNFVVSTRPIGCPAL